MAHATELTHKRDPTQHTDSEVRSKIESASRNEMRARATGVPPAASHAEGSFGVRWLGDRLGDIVMVVRW